jgi:inorganic pyrophosphatase
MSNLFHNLPPGPNFPEEVYCLVEIDRGGSNKYEYDKELGVFRLDRALYGSVFYPTEYGFIPQTWSADDGDPLDIMVLSTFPTFPGCLLKSRPIGLLKMTDSGRKDNKIIAAASDDPRFDEVKNLDDLEPHFKKEIENFWGNYSDLQPDKEIKVLGWSGVEKAYKIIEKANTDYQEKFGEKNA